MKTTDLIYAIDVLANIVKPIDNKISFQTQNKAQSILSELVHNLELRVEDEIKNE